MSVHKLHLAFITSENTAVRRKICEDLCSKIQSAAPRFELSLKEYITANDPGELTKQPLGPLVNMEKTNLALYDDQIKKMHVKQLSNSLKHADAVAVLLKAANSTPASSNDHFFVLEDDILFRQDVVDELATILPKIPSDADVVMFGMCETVGAFKPFDVHSRILPLCNAYWLSRRALTAIAKGMRPVKFVGNTMLSYVCDKENLRVYTAPSNLLLDGSKYGLYLSVLNSNNMLSLNAEYMALRELVTKKDPYAPQDLEKVTQLLQAIKFKNNPHVLHLQALHEMKQGQFEKAKGLYEEGYKLMTQNDMLINNESDFLKDYMSVFKHLQTTAV